MESNIFQNYCNEVVNTHSEIIESWITSNDPFKRALGKLVKENGGRQ